MKKILITLSSVLLGTQLVGCNSGSNAIGNSNKNINTATTEPKSKHVPTIIAEHVNVNYDLFIAEAYPDHQQFAELEMCHNDIYIRNMIYNNISECTNPKTIYNNKDFYALAVSNKNATLFAGTSTGGIIELENPSKPDNTKTIQSAIKPSQNKIDILLYNENNNVLLAGSKDDNYATVIDANTLQNLYSVTPENFNNNSLNNVLPAIIDNKDAYIIIFNDNRKAYLYYVFADELTANVRAGVTRHDLMTLTSETNTQYTFGVSADKKKIFVSQASIEKKSKGTVTNYSSGSTYYQYNENIYSYDLTKQTKEPIYHDSSEQQENNYKITSIVEANDAVYFSRGSNLFECSNTNSNYTCQNVATVKFANQIEFLKYDYLSGLLFMGSGTGKVGGSLKALNLQSKELTVIMDNKYHGIYDAVSLVH